MQPSRVLVYRDGVGEGQIEYVRDHEIAGIQVKNSGGVCSCYVFMEIKVKVVLYLSYSL